MAKYGIYEKALLFDNLEKSLSFAKNAGYDYWEISIDNEKKGRLNWTKQEIQFLLDVCEKTSMPIFNMVLSIHRDYPLGSRNEAIRKKGIDYLKKAIIFADRMNIRTIQLAGYYSSMDNTEDGSLELFIKTLQECVTLASERGILLGIENMDRNLINVKDILFVIGKVNNPYLKMFLDVGNFAANDLNVVKQLEVGLPHLIGLHLKEAKIGEYRRIPFGQGIVDFKTIFKHLDENGYDGYFGVEMWNDDSADSLKIVEGALEWLKSNK